MKIVKVNNLPQTYEADTIYLVKSSTAGLVDIYVTDNIGTQIRSLAVDTAVINSLLPISEVGVSVASLVDGKIPTNQLPSAILGALTYQDTWNASTNAPTIPAASPSNKGWYYVVNTAGTASIGGINDWQIGDWLVSNGVSWGKIDNSDKVSSVAGKTGVVTLSKADVGLGNVDNTSDANKPVSSAAQTALNLKAPLADPTFTGIPKAPTAVVGTSTTQLATTAFVNAEIANSIGAGTGGPASGDRVSVVYGPYPYWRVAAASVEDRYLVCTGLEFTNITDGANVAVGGTPMSSGVFGSNVAANAFDGDDGTFWEGNASEINGAANKWIGYHFPAPVEITEVRWTNDAGAEPAESLRYGLVQFSNDGVRWFTAWDFTVDTWGAGVTTEVTRPLPLLVAAAGGNGIIPLGYAPIRNWDLSRGYMFKMTIEGNTVLNLPSNLRPGSWVMYVKQDAVGGHRMDFQAGYYGPRGLLPVLSTLPNAVDILTFTSDGEHLAVSIQANLALA